MSPQTGQWADSLLAFEKLHLLRVIVWAAVSITVGTGALAIVRLRRLDAPLITHFAIQSIAWGALDLLVAASSHRTLQLRDLASAVAFDRFAWLSVGLDLGVAGVGIALAIVGWTHGRRLGLVGAGAGVVMQGVAHALLHLQLATAIVR